MAQKLLMLALSPTMESGIIALWHKGEGDSFVSGDALCDVETDKTTMTYEASYDGTLLKIIAQKGAALKIGESMAITGALGEDISELTNKKNSMDAKAQPAAALISENSVPIISPIPNNTVSAPPVPAEKFPYGKPITPFARAFAQEKHLDIEAIHGTGPGGRIVKEDIAKVLSNPPKVSDPTQTNILDHSIPISAKRRIIAERMMLSTSTIPQYHLSAAINMERLILARAEINNSSSDTVSLNAFFLKLIAQVLKQHPMLNASWNMSSITLHERIDIGIAVALGDGLITPVVCNCAGKGVMAIDAELKILIDKAKKNTLLPEEYTNATFTISNLGNMGIRDFSAIINPPQAAILAIGEIAATPVVNKQGDIVVQRMCIIACTCDHRIIDGSVAARFLKDLKACFEEPLRALL